MTKEEVDFIGGMNMCDEISNEAYKKIMCHCEEQDPCEDAISREDVVERSKIDEAILGMERERNSEFWNSSFRDGIDYALELLKKNLDIGNELNEDREVEE